MLFSDNGEFIPKCIKVSTIVKNELSKLLSLKYYIVTLYENTIMQYFYYTVRLSPQYEIA